MPVGLLQEFDATPEMYDAITNKMDVKNNPPEGNIFHTAGRAEDGKWRIFDVWESRDAFERFRRERLEPAMSEVAREMGMSGPPPSPDRDEMYELHNLMGA